MFERQHVSDVRNRLREPRRTIIALTGPRQVGKTTIVRQALAEIDAPVVYENADGLVRPADGWIADIWARARAAATGGTAVIVIDEIQKVTDWSESLKREWDADTWNGVDIRVVILGSSTLLLNTGLRESLAGRFERIRVMPWSYTEMHEAFGMDLDDVAVYGGYPGAAEFVADPPRWKSYMLDSIIEPVVLKDVLQMQRIDNPALLRQLFMVGAALSARVVSFTKLLGMVQDRGNAATIINYLDLLEEAGLLCGLNKYRTSVMKKRSSPKLQVFANGVATACGAEWSRSMSNDRRGRCYESLIGSHLRNAVEGTPLELGWWRDGSVEVDFVLHGDRSRTAIEVSTGVSHSRRGLELFKSNHPDAHTMLVGPGGVPFEEFLSMPVHALIPDHK